MAPKTALFRQLKFTLVALCLWAPCDYRLAAVDGKCGERLLSAASAPVSLNAGARSSPLLPTIIAAGRASRHETATASRKPVRTGGLTSVASFSVVDN